MADSYLLLEDHFRKISRLDHALTFLHWDHQVMMPPGGSEPRARTLAELTALRHQLLTSPQVADLLDRAATRQLAPERARSLAEMARLYRQAASVPAELVKAKTLAGARCEHGWRNQRHNNDWPGFLANFTEVVELARQEARARQEGGPENFPTPYDALLDLYCTGDSSAFIAEVFATLKTVLPPLVEVIVAKQRPLAGPELAGHYPLDRQRQLNLELMRCLGFDFSEGRLDESSHPFSTGCRGDHRITTRFRETEFFEALAATAHETGHAGYEGGLPLEWDELPAGASRNMCLHESQSLLFEKMIFLSRPFLGFFAAKIHALLPATAALDANRLWTAATRVQPSYIRVEADEVTYPLHVILRYEIERDLINGTIAAGDLPAAWDDRMQRYLGLSTKGNYRDGCLQDIHWTDGTFGYFPSYTIGALNSAQLFAAIRRGHPDWQERLAAGETAFVRRWLAENIWQKGSTLDSQEIIGQATGQATACEAFLDHLRQRYLDEAY